MFNKLFLQEVRCPTCKKLLGKCWGVVQIKCSRCKEIHTITTQILNVQKEEESG